MPRQGLNDGVGYSFTTEQRNEQVPERVKADATAQPLFFADFDPMQCSPQSIFWARVLNGSCSIL